MVGKYLANLHLNKTIWAYIINIVSKRQKIQYSSVRRGVWLEKVATSPNFYTCVIESVVVNRFEFTVNEATTSS